MICGLNMIEKWLDMIKTWICQRTMIFIDIIYQKTILDLFFSEKRLNLTTKVILFVIYIVSNWKYVMIMIEFWKPLLWNGYLKWNFCHSGLWFFQFLYIFCDWRSWWWSHLPLKCVTCWTINKKESHWDGNLKKLIF